MLSGMSIKSLALMGLSLDIFGAFLLAIQAIGYARIRRFRNFLVRFSFRPGKRGGRRVLLPRIEYLGLALVGMAVAVVGAEYLGTGNVFLAVVFLTLSAPLFTDVLFNMIIGILWLSMRLEVFGWAGLIGFLCLATGFSLQTTAILTA